MELKCPVCGSTKFDSPKTIRNHEGPIRYIARNAWFGGSLKLMGRACLVCGYVSLTVDPLKLLEELGKQ